VNSSKRVQAPHTVLPRLRGGVEWIPTDVWNWIKVVGCTSHGDFQSGWDTVLDEVLQLPQRREQPNGSMYIYVNDVKALRQKAGEP